MNYYQPERTKFKSNVGVSVLTTGEYKILDNGQIVRKEPKHGRNEINPETGFKYKKGTTSKKDVDIVEIIDNSTSII